MSAAPLPYGEAQALVRSGFGSLPCARYLLLDIADAALARPWLASFAPTSVAEIEGSRVACVRQLAVSHAGLRALGMPSDALESFPAEFQLGMGSDTVAARLGDSGENGARDWQWGQAGSEPHLLVILFATETEIARHEMQLSEEAAVHGLRVRAVHASDGAVDKEPFGFRDGISQPEIDWSGRAPQARHEYSEAMALGELLLGYPNEYGLLPDSPRLASFDLGRNGSYLVFRRLAQDVAGFWQWALATAGDREGALVLAERMVGRRLDGALLPGLTEDQGRFSFTGDPDGRHCPVPSHIRRCNPRIGDLPRGRRGFLGAIVDMLGFTGEARGDAVAAARFHRIVRRGRPYGKPLSPDEALDGASQDSPTGLNFICLNANIARQFEFVQGAWLNSARFAGLSQQGDPLTGARTGGPGGRRADSFAFIDALDRLTLVEDIPPFVRVEAGGYFFLPSITALQRIAGMA